MGYSLLTKAPLIYDWEFKYFIGFKTENSQQAVITQSFYCKKYYYLHISEQIKVELTSTWNISFELLVILELVLSFRIW